MKHSPFSRLIHAAFTGRHYLAVCCLVLMALGLYALIKLPVQLLPTIESNTIDITNDWPAASVEEVSTQLVVPMEELLANVSGLKEMVSDISEGWAVTTLSFHPSTDMQQAYIDVVNRVNQQSNRPQAAREPEIVSQASGIKTAVATLLMLASDTDSEESEGFARDRVSSAFRQHVRPAVEAIPGVDQLITSFNPVDQRLDIVFDPAKLAAYQLSVDQLKSILQNATDRSAGRLSLGSREYTLRFKGRENIEQLSSLQIADRNGRKVYLRDVAYIERNYFRAAGGAYRNGEKVLYVRVNQAYGANSLDIMQALKQTLAELNQGPLAETGVELTISRDDSKSINDAINVVKTSLLLGMLLATGVLFFFVRKPIVVAILFSQIPIAMLLTVLILQLAERSLNVVSLVGIALSTGLIIDAAIVVVENILRHKQHQPLDTATIVSAVAEVASALVTSVISSVVVFLPILYLQAEEGQLFKDLAITISSTLLASLILAVTILPLLCQRYLVNIDATNSVYHKPSERLQQAANALITLGSHPLKRAVILVALLLLPLTLSSFILPGADILPNAKDRVVRVGLSFSEKMSLEALDREIVQTIVQRLEQHRLAKTEPAIERFVIFYSESGGTLYIYPQNPAEIKALVKTLDERLLADISGARAITHIASLLRLSLSSDRNVVMDLQGVSIEKLMTVADSGMTWIKNEIPEARVSPLSPLVFNARQLLISPKESNILLAGETRGRIGEVVRALNDGVYVSDYYDGQRNVPMFLKSPGNEHLNDFLNTPIYTQTRSTQPLQHFIHAEFATGPTALMRVNGETGISLAIRPPEDTSLEVLIKQLKTRVEPQLKQALGPAGRIHYRGSASKLEQLLAVMTQQFRFALFILFLLMFAMFQSIRNATLVMLSLPIAVFGGIIGLRVLNLFVDQSLDVMTMIGFVILLGLVINNTILFMSQLSADTAPLHQALKNTLVLRVRPIYMSTITSMLGMLPLALSPGIGTEIYRGLAVVIIGGLSFSALFTLLLLTAMAQSRLYHHRELPSGGDQQPRNKERDHNLSLGLTDQEEKHKTPQHEAA